MAPPYNTKYRSVHWPTELRGSFDELFSSHPFARTGAECVPFRFISFARDIAWVVSSSAILTAAPGSVTNSTSDLSLRFVNPSLHC